MGLVSCNLIGALRSDSVSPSAWQRVIRCGPGGAAGQRAKRYFRARLDQIIDLDHPLAKLGRVINWRFLEGRFGAVYSDKAGHPPLPTRLIAGLSILKHMHDLSDEDLCARWIENPYYQLFCGEEFFPAQADLRPLVADALEPAEWRGEARGADPGEPVSGDAHRRGQALRRLQVIVDTTVQPKAVAFPTDAKLISRARQRLVKLARKTGVSLRQSYERVGKHALIAHRALRPRQAVQARQPGAGDDPHLSRPGQRATWCARSRATPKRESVFALR